MDQTHLTTNIILNCRCFIIGVTKVGVRTLIFVMYNFGGSVDPLFFPSSIFEILKFVPGM